jgi:hypothetical protein
MDRIKVKRDSSKIKIEEIIFNDSLINEYFDSIKNTYNYNLALLQDTLKALNEKINIERNNLWKNLANSEYAVGTSKTLRNVFVFNWYDEKPIDDIELSVIKLISKKDSIHGQLFSYYYQKMALCNEVISNNKKSSKHFSKILSLLKKNKKNNVYNKEVEEEFEFYKERWDTYNKCLDPLEFTDMKDVKYQCVSNKNVVIGEMKRFKKEKTVELKRYSNWNRYYHLMKIKWSKATVLDDKYCNSCVQQIRWFKTEAKEEIKKLEEEQRKKEKKLSKD